MADTTPAPLNERAIAKMRKRLEIPDGGDALRRWIRYKLGQIHHEKTGKAWTQTDIARAAYVSEPTVSIVYTGGRATGPRSGRVRRLTAQLLQVPEEVLFPAVEYNPTAVVSENGESGG